MYSKSPKLKKTAAKITSFSSLIAGAALIIFSGKMPLSWLSQTVSIALLTLSIYVMSCYLLREYIFCVEPSNKADISIPDFVIYENKGSKKNTVCRLGFDEITAINEVCKENKARIKEERKALQRFRYNAQYAAQKFIEIRAQDDISVFITYDSELFEVLSEYHKKYRKNSHDTAL